MANPTPRSPGRPTSPPSPIQIVQNFIDKYPENEVTYILFKEGEEHERTYQFVYKMGKRVLAWGHVMTKQQDAKRCAAHKTERVLRGERYDLCAKSENLCSHCVSRVALDSCPIPRSDD